MNAFEFVDIFIYHFFGIGEQSKTNHLVCGDLNRDIAVESDREQKLIQNLLAL